MIGDADGMTSKNSKWAVQTEIYEESQMDGMTTGACATDGEEEENEGGERL